MSHMCRCTFLARNITRSETAKIDIFTGIHLANVSAALQHATSGIRMAKMSLTEIKTAVSRLSPEELADLITFIRERDSAAWDRQIDADFDEGGRLRPVLEEVRADLHAGRVEEMP